MRLSASGGSYRKRCVNAQAPARYMGDREGVVDLAPDLSFHGARLARGPGGGPATRMVK